MAQQFVGLVRTNPIRSSELPWPLVTSCTTHLTWPGLADQSSSISLELIALFIRNYRLTLLPNLGLLHRPGFGPASALHSPPSFCHPEV